MGRHIAGRFEGRVGRGLVPRLGDGRAAFPAEAAVVRRKGGLRSRASSGKWFGVRFRGGIGPATPYGGFHSSATDAVFSLASFDLKNSSRIG